MRFTDARTFILYILVRLSAQGSWLPASSRRRPEPEA